MKRNKVEPKTVVYEIVCDRCGKAVQNNGCGFDAMTSIEIQAGYASIFGDGNRVEIDLCEPCLRETLGTWLRVTTHEDAPLARMLANFKPELHGGEFPTAADSTRVPPEDGPAQERVPLDEEVPASESRTDALPGELGVSDDFDARLPAEAPPTGSMSHAPTSPEGYASWLEFAVETFDTRGPWLEGLFSEQGAPLDRDAMREAARSELAQRRLQSAGERTALASANFAPKGIYRFKTHDDANKQEDAWLAEGMARLALERQKGARAKQASAPNVFNPAAALDSEEAIAAYLSYAEQSRNPGYLEHAKGFADRARAKLKG